MRWFYSNKRQSKQGGWFKMVLNYSYYSQIHQWMIISSIRSIISSQFAGLFPLISSLFLHQERLLLRGRWDGTNQGASELLNITVGTQSISPLYWAIESGSLNTAKAMLEESHLEIECWLTGDENRWWKQVMKTGDENRWWKQVINRWFPSFSREIIFNHL